MSLTSIIFVYTKETEMKKKKKILLHERIVSYMLNWTKFCIGVRLYTYNFHVALPIFWFWQYLRTDK